MLDLSTGTHVPMVEGSGYGYALSRTLDCGLKVDLVWASWLNHNWITQLQCSFVVKCEDMSRASVPCSWRFREVQMKSFRWDLRGNCERFFSSVAKHGLTMWKGNVEGTGLHRVQGNRELRNLGACVSPLVGLNGPTISHIPNIRKHHFRRGLRHALQLL